MFRASRYLTLCFCLVSSLLAAAPTSDYTTLKKFLAARMYVEAYVELLKCELNNKSEDPKLTKLKKDLLPNARKEATNRAKVRADDPLVFTVLADLDYQENQIERGIANITKALNGDSGTLTNYVFAKLLFAKGNLSQAADAMEKALAADPGLETVFEDFQFLYHCKNYGLAAAKRLSPDPGFLVRAKQVASSGPPQPPESPFENDPTRPPEVVMPPDPEPDPLLTAQTPKDPVFLPVELKNPDRSPKLPGDKPPSEDVNAIDNSDNLPEKPTVTQAQPPKEPVARPTEDPEQKRIKQAEELLAHARRKYQDKQYDDAESVLKKALKLCPDLIHANELQKQIDDKRKIRKDYKLAVSLYENNKYDLARDPILKAYTEEPESYPEAPFYLGKIFLLGSKKDLKKSREFFEIYLQSEKADPDLKRDVEWVVIGILADDEQYEEAYRRFNDFAERESEYARNRETFWRLKYRLWYMNNQTAVHVGFVCFVGAFILVFLLMILPSFNILIRDPLAKAQKAFVSKNYQKVVQIAEDFLKRGKQPVQVQRQVLELLVESHFHLKNFFKCQTYGKELLQLFPDNMVAWTFLAKAYVETNDSSDEAITMYETLYKKNPENKQYLPILCKYYASHKHYTLESLEIMYAYFQKEPGNKENTLALANGLVQTKRISDEVIPVLLEALKIQPRNLDYRELLARNYSKKNQYVEAVRECLQVLEGNINNMGIHVVYTTCMKKLNMLEEAVLQYEDFMRKYPKNMQIVEILTGLRKELETQNRVTTAPNHGLSPFSDDLVVEGFTMPDADIDSGLEGFVEPPPEGVDRNAEDIPIPDFLKAERQGQENPTIKSVDTVAAAPVRTTSASEFDDVPTLDPFANDAAGVGTLFTDIDLLPKLPVSKKEMPKPSAIAPADPPALQEPLESISEVAAPVPAAAPSKREATAVSIPTGSAGPFDLDECRRKLQQKKGKEVIDLLAPVFARQRSKTVGIVLAEAYLQTKQADLAKEILETIDCDWEIMSDDLKDICYRVGVALEEQNKPNEALILYDKICNVDIDFRDTFDRSDRLYSERKKKKH